MNKICKTVMIALVPAFLPVAWAGDGSAVSANVVLAAPQAVVTPKKVSLKRNKELTNWRKDGVATWHFETDGSSESQYVLLEYSSAEALAFTYRLDGKDVSCDLRATGGAGDFRTEKIGDVILPAGEHELKIVNSKPGAFINLRTVEITSQTPPPFSYEYPAVYSRQGSWAESMTALRAAYRDPKMDAARLHYGKKLDLYLNQKDGKALWTDFPKQSDWFLQDNQVHGSWGQGVYDARQDYKNYLDPSRDNTLEQKLIAQVLAELGSRADEFTNPLKRLVSENCSPDNPAWLALYEEACAARRQSRLSALLKQTDQVVYATHQNMGIIYLETETQGCPDGSQLRVIDLSPEANGQPLKDDVLFDSNNGIVRDPEISFDGKKMLFSWRKTNAEIKTSARLAPATGNYKIYEMTLADRSTRPLTTDATYGADIEPCYLPNGDIMFSSARCVQEVTCGWGDCSNLFLMNKDGKYARRIGFDQTQTAFPHLLNDGRIVFTRRDYNDRGQSYAHALFVMNSDGTTQTEYYGNNSMAPTSIQHTRPIPGSRKTMGIAGGYHTSQGGKLVTIDPTKGRQNYDGLTFYNWEPTPLAQVSDENYCRVGEQFVYPYPLDENSLLVSCSPIGAYLTSANGKLNKDIEQGCMLYNLYYMTLDGRRELLASHPELSCTQAVPVRPRKAPATRASTVDYTKKTGTCYVQNVYYGPSAEGIKPGSIKKLRVVKLFYKPITIGAGGWSPPRDTVGPLRKYSGYGWHSVLPTGVGSASFDAKEILGEVDVHEDGSAMFEIPARTPVFFQLVDENGLVAQTMRSWATLMPNENFSCVGCHEENDSAPLPQAMKTLAMQRPPQRLQPVHGITGAPFSYAKMVQPVLNKHCASCHSPGKKAGKIDLSDTIVSDNPQDTWASSTRRKFYQSYLTLLDVKWDSSNRKTKGPRLDEGRPNKWVDYYTRMATMELTPPYFSGSSQSGVIRLLLKGHGRTKITPEEIGIIAAWIDLNVPFVGEYDEMNIWDAATKARYDEKLGMRYKQEEIETGNIQAYINDGQL